MAKIQAISWNLKKRDAALHALLEHLARLSRRGELFVAAVQECTDDAAALVEALSKLGAAAHAEGNGTMSVLCSHPLTPVKQGEAGVGLRLVLTGAHFDNEFLAIVNYHGHARHMPSSPLPEECGGIASEARWRIDKHAANAHGVLVLGDFNAAPVAPEVRSTYCLALGEDIGSADFSHDRRRRVLRAQSPERGTYLWHRHSLGTEWQTLDFMACEPEHAFRVRALESLNGRSLLVEERPALSDHLPVAGTMEWP